MDSEGRFLFINGILCRTADNTGAFCPADVFSGYDPNCFLKEPPSRSMFDKLAADRTEEELDAQEMPIIASTCPLYHCFGVLSGGVLVDPRNNEFVDFTDTCTYNPMQEVEAPPQPPPGHTRDEKEKKEEGAGNDGGSQPNKKEKKQRSLHCKRVKRRIQRNQALYQAGRLDEIRAEAVVSLISSCEPIGTKGSLDTPLMPPNTYPAPIGRSELNPMHRENMQYMKRHSVLALEPRSRRRRRALLRNLNITELFRLCNKQSSNFYGSAPSVAPPLFHLQANGTRAMPYDKGTALKGDKDTAEDSSLQLLGASSAGSDGGDCDTSTLPAFASSFVPVLGHLRTSVTLKLNREVSGARFAGPTSVNLLTWNKLYSIYAPLHSWAAARPLETQLLPPWHYSLLPVVQMEWVYRHYFRVLGVKESAADGTRTFELSPDEDYSVSDAVSVAVNGTPTRNLSAQVQKAICTQTSNRQLIKSWLYLFTHSRERIVNRLRAILQYLFDFTEGRSHHTLPL